jgi:hypothetical protein
VFALDVVAGEREPNAEGDDCVPKTISVPPEM